MQTDLSRELFPDVFPGGHQLGPLFNQGVRTPGLAVGYIAGNGEHFPVLLQGAAGGNAGAAIFARLDDQNTQGQAADNPVGD